MSVRPSVRFEVLQRDWFTCRYCNRSGVELEIDHIIPRAKGGTDTELNLVTSCHECNSGKSAKAVLEPPWWDRPHCSVFERPFSQTVDETNRDHAEWATCHWWCMTECKADPAITGEPCPLSIEAILPWFDVFSPRVIDAAMWEACQPPRTPTEAYLVMFGLLDVWAQHGFRLSGVPTPALPGIS